MLGAATTGVGEAITGVAGLVSRLFDGEGLQAVNKLWAITRLSSVGLKMSRCMTNSFSILTGVITVYDIF